VNLTHGKEANMSTRPHREPRPRAALALIAALLCLTAAGCREIPSAAEPAGTLIATRPDLIDSVPLEYGRLVGISQHTAGPNWVMLWFEAEDRSITAVGVNIHHGRYDSVVLQIPRTGGTP